MKNYIRLTFLFLFINLFSNAQIANWSAVLPAQFPTNASGQIHGISRTSQMKFHHSDANKMYAVSARGGLFISADGGNNWAVTPGTDFMPNNSFASVCIDFTDDQVLYLGTGDHNYYGGGSGVWKSTNGGLTFTQTTLTGKLIIDMIMDPLDHNIIVAITNSGIYKTLNAGATWSIKTTARAFDDLKQKTNTSRVLFACTNDSAFFRSADFGDTWSQITAGIVLPAGITNGNGCRIGVTPADTNVVYLGMVANSGLIYKSTNGGTSFTAQKTTASPYLTYYDNSASSSGQGDYNFGIGVDRLNPNILFLVAHNNWRSTDGGVTWTQLTNWWAKCHTDMHQIIKSPYNNNQLWNMNDGGVWLSVDNGNNWTPKSDGIYGYEIYHGNCSPTRKDMFSIGTQDNGELYATSTGWFTNRGGDWGSQCAFDYRTNSSMVYYFQNNKRRLTNGSDATYGLPAQVTQLNDIAFHRSNQNLAFVADSIIYRTTNLLATTPAWTQIANLGKKIKAMHCAYGNANYLYIITSDATIYVSKNALSAAPTFTSYTLPNSTNNDASITSIKTSPNIVYITCNTKAFRSSDEGATWTNITYNLPPVNHVRILADEYYPANEMVLVASNNTVYYKVATAALWSVYNANLPSRTEVIDLSIFNDSTPNTALRLATYGRGMWETSITSLRSLNAKFAANNTNPCNGTAVNFSDLSTGTITSRNWTFTGATPATSTLSNPSVVYSNLGNYSVTLTISDGVTSTSTTQTNYITTYGGNLPINEGFEGADNIPAGWNNVDNATGGVLWAKTSLAGGYGASANAMIFDNYSWNNPGEKDELQVKRLDFSGYTSAKLTFDVAYQVFSGYADTLAVLVSTDCGNTFTKVYVKGGTVLSTAGSGGNNFVPTAAQWRTETINLNAYLGQAGVIVAFQNTCGYGNKLYIDNVNITATINANAGTDKTICLGGNATIGVAPVPGFTYSWSPAIGLSSSTLSNPVASPTSFKNYVLTVTKISSGVTETDSVSVFVNNIAISATPTNVNCNGESTGSAIAIATGTPPYNFLWSNGETLNTVSNINAGTYSVTVTDANGCTKSISTVITEPAALIASITPIATTCGLSNGMLVSAAGGGTLNYSYLWSNGSVFSSISNLPSGTYTLTITDGNGCTISHAVPVAASSGVGGVAVSSITTNSAIINWNASPDAVSYNLQYRIAGSGSWTLVSGITNTTYTLLSLSAATPYDVQIQSDCGNGLSVFTSTNFTTTSIGCVDTYEPNNTSATAKPITINTNVQALISPSTDKDYFSFKNSLAKPNIRVTLTNLPANYDMQLSKSSALATSANTGTTSETIIYNTTVNGTYKIKIYGKNGANNALQCYTLKAETSATPFIPKMGDVVATDNVNELTVYPNPASDEITIVLPESMNNADVQVIIINALGQTVKKLNAANAGQLQLNVSELPNGIYQLSVTNAGTQLKKQISIAR